MKTDLKYTFIVEGKSGGKTWRFSPPEDTIRAGVAKRESFRDGRTARVAILKYLATIEAFRRGELAADTVGKTSTIAQLIAHYKTTRLFTDLSKNSKIAYSAAFRSIVRTPIGIHNFGEVKIEDLTARMCTQVYEQWSQSSASAANAKSRVFSVLMSYCISLDMIVANPMTKVKKLLNKPRSVVWTKDQVSTFLDEAFKSFKYRGIGLLVFMSYEWCQRPIDIRQLVWNSINLDKQTVSIKQKKRGAEVELPISGSLLGMLKDQKNDYDFQDYVIPHLRKGDNTYRPYSRTQMVRLVNEVLAKAGLPEELRAGDLRKTGIMEMCEAGVDSTLIMSVSGHKNISSLNPYIKHTLKAATKALTIRGG